MVTPTPDVLNIAQQIQLQTRAQFWDALIYAACREAAVQRLYSEDVPGGSIQGLEVINPFA